MPAKPTTKRNPAASTVSVSLPAEIKKKLSAAAKNAGVTQSKFIADLIAKIP